ncbi:ABC-type antimicrobial peptide transport system permease component [alpha proteobacterium U9-1i]|nr:ABC-type antimicrobial peptide transport system permease component [alpha proteobacterium U9-1i]
MNDLTLMRKNLFRKPVRTTLLIVSIFIAFLIFSVMLSFNHAINNFNTLPTRMVTLSKINFTESLPIAHYDRVARMEGVQAATHMNWFGGYYQDPVQGFMPVFAVDPETYFQVYSEDLQIPAAQRDAFFNERTAMLVAEPVAERWGWRVGQRIPINSNIFTNSTTGNSSWEFTLVGTIPTPPGSSQSGSVLINYDYFNETITFGRDRIGWIPFLTSSATINERVANAIDQRFANSQDETSTQDEATFNAGFAAQLGNIALVITLVVGSAFAAILLIVGTTMALAVRERTKEVGVMKTLGFSSGRVLRMVLGESMLLSFVGAGLGMLAAVGVLALMSQMSGGQGPPISFAPSVLGWGALVALGLGLLTGLPPALAAYRMRIIDAFARR